MTDADRTYMNLMIFKIMSSTKGRISVNRFMQQLSQTWEFQFEAYSVI